MQRLGTIELRDVESNDKEVSIFVLNKTKGLHRGQVLISVPKARGVGNDGVTIPATFIPIELTAQVSKTQLLDSAEFRRSISSGMLVLVKSEDAINYMKTEEAKMELERLRESKQIHRKYMTATDVSDIEVADIPTEDLSENKNEVRSSNMIDERGRVNNVLLSVIQLVEGYRDSGNTQDENNLLASLKGAGELEKADYKYIFKQLEAKTNPKVYDWARKEYNSLKKDN